MEDRVRKVDLESKTQEEFEALIKRIDEKEQEIVLEACTKLNKILNPYGIKVTKFTYEREKIDN